MTLRLDPVRLRELQRQAREAGLRPGQLAQRWVEERLGDGSAGVAAPEGRPDLSQVNARLDELGSRLDEVAEQVAALLSARQGATMPPRDGAPPPARRARLHEEIVAVLHASGGPMSAGEIAQAIRERGQFRAPRSNEEVNGAMVSGRVSNPHYRALFVREGRKIGLAERPSDS
ncbi:MAG: hypothetical protein ABR509_05115 [Candidatus Limnocylindria bacterium]